MSQNLNVEKDTGDHLVSQKKKDIYSMTIIHSPQKVAIPKDMVCSCNTSRERGSLMELKLSFILPFPKYSCQTLKFFSGLPAPSYTRQSMKRFRTPAGK